MNHASWCFSYEWQTNSEDIRVVVDLVNLNMGTRGMFHGFHVPALRRVKLPVRANSGMLWNEMGSVYTEVEQALSRVQVLNGATRSSTAPGLSGVATHRGISGLPYRLADAFRGYSQIERGCLNTVLQKRDEKVAAVFMPVGYLYNIK